MTKKFIIKYEKGGGARKMNAATMKACSYRGKKETATEGYAASTLLRMDKVATKKIRQAEEDIKAGRTRSLREILTDE